MIEDERGRKMKKVKFIHDSGYGEHEKDVEVVEFPEGTTEKDIEKEFENFVWEKIGDDPYWEKAVRK